MHLNLPDKLETFTQQQVGAGYYSSASEYIRELIRKDMQDKNEQRIQVFRSAVHVGDQQIIQGSG
ncbi:MAG: type II toxin-antitoxin system ParD family antitoxin, partial [Cyanobacteria bacterium J06649_11]